MTTLENFYYGNISPHENIVKQTGLFAKVLNKMSKAEDNLTATLSEEQKTLFNKFIETNSKLCDINEKEAFIRSFKLGLRFMFDILNSKMYTVILSIRQPQQEYSYFARCCLQSCH